MRIMVFIDYWNLQLTLNSKLSAVKNTHDYRAKIDWRSIGPIFAEMSSGVLQCDLERFSLE